ncbi:MAG: hypothetical protein COA79_22200 [Planctomycetota bacterium]|nr:MAG: hypothetical protein COA79_22200 [Planctomycetota bacterium]
MKIINIFILFFLVTSYLVSNEKENKKIVEEYLKKRNKKLFELYNTVGQKDEFILYNILRCYKREVSWLGDKDGIEKNKLFLNDIYKGYYDDHNRMGYQIKYVSSRMELVRTFCTKIKDDNVKFDTSYFYKGAVNINFCYMYLSKKVSDKECINKLKSEFEKSTKYILATFDKKEELVSLLYNQFHRCYSIKSVYKNFLTDKVNDDLLPNIKDGSIKYFFFAITYRNINYTPKSRKLISKAVMRVGDINNEESKINFKGAINELNPFIRDFDKKYKKIISKKDFIDFVKIYDFADANSLFSNNPTSIAKHRAKVIEDYR